MTLLGGSSACAAPRRAHGQAPDATAQTADEPQPKCEDPGARPDPSDPPTAPDSDDPLAVLDGFCEGVMPPDAEEYAQHVQALQRRLAETEHGAFVTEPGATMQYLSGVRWGRSERPFLMVVPKKGAPRWIVPAFEERTAREQLGDPGLWLWREHQDPYARVDQALTDAGLGHPSVAVDGQLRHFIVAGLQAALGRNRVADGASIIAHCRMHKSPQELARLRRANEATKAALAVVATAHTLEGMTQAELAALVRKAQARAGLSEIWVLALVGPNAAYPHGTRDDRTITPGELILVDTGGSLYGYHSDITRTWAVGDPPASARRAYEAVAAAQRAAYAQIRPGVRCRDVDAAARAVIAQAGFGPGDTAFTHRLGHGIGLEVHEPPYLVGGNDRVLAPGMTMSNEPGIYVPGSFGVRIEDIVAVTEHGYEVFGPTVGELDDPFGGR